MKRWRARCRREVDWEGVVREGGETGVRAGRARGDAGEGTQRRRRGKGKGGKGGEVQQEEEEQEEAGEEGEGHSAGAAEEGAGGFDDDEYPFLTVGLIGQPNVGKSSLLNALLGRKVVRASRTPGKTKTLQVRSSLLCLLNCTAYSHVSSAREQTIYWNATLRLCDCPGLVCPSSAGFERQVLGGVLPIQNVEAVLHLVGQRLPLEKVLRLRHEDEVREEGRDEDEDEFSLDSPEERRRERERRREEMSRWTTDELLAAYAVQQGALVSLLLSPLPLTFTDCAHAPPTGFVTAKVGRPDIYRAGAHILRLLHASAIPWAFHPPGPPPCDKEGVWLRGFVPRAEVAGEGEGASEYEDDEEEEGEELTEGEEEDEEEDSADEKAVKAVRGAFAALAVEGEDDDDEDDEEDEDGSDGGSDGDVDDEDVSGDDDVGDK